MDIRQIILQHLADTDRSRYWLAQQAMATGSVGRQTVLRYLAGHHDMTGQRIGTLLDILDLAIVPTRNESVS